MSLITFVVVTADASEVLAALTSMECRAHLSAQNPRCAAGGNSDADVRADTYEADARSSAATYWPAVSVCAVSRVAAKVVERLACTAATLKPVARLFNGSTNSDAGTGGMFSVASTRAMYVWFAGRELRW